MAKLPRVWHVNDPACPADAVYVGRPTKWGNPFVLGRDGTRAEVIARHRDWMTQHHPELIEAARRELRGYDLACWCAPKPCHADFWLEVANAE